MAGTDANAGIALHAQALIPDYSVMLIFLRRFSAISLNRQRSRRTPADTEAAAAAQLLCLRVVAIGAGDITSLDEYGGTAARAIHNAQWNNLINHSLGRDHAHSALTFLFSRCAFR